MLLGGAVVTEVVFAWPGLGRELVAAIAGADLPLIAGAVLDGISAEMQASGVDLGAVEELPEEALPEVVADIVTEIMAPVEGAEAVAPA